MLDLWRDRLSLSPHHFSSCSLMPSGKKQISYVSLAHPIDSSVSVLLHRCLSIKWDALIYFSYTTSMPSLLA